MHKQRETNCIIMTGTYQFVGFLKGLPFPTTILNAMEITYTGSTDYEATSESNFKCIQMFRGQNKPKISRTI